MEEDHEVLDWSNDDDEQQQPLKRDLDDRRDRDMDDSEDAVSLGDEDEQDYYTQLPQGSAGSLAEKESPPSTAPGSTNESQDFQHSLAQSTEGSRRERPSVSRDTPHQTAIDSPRTKGNSDEQQSPQRSQQSSTATRLKHALPPKPVAASMPYLHPSHPSIVEATAMSKRQGRSESNRSKANPSSPTVFCVGTGRKRSSSTGNVDADTLPPNWETRESRSGDGVYYYNVTTTESTWIRPTGTSDSALVLRETRVENQHRRRGGSVSAGDQSLTQFRSDRPQSQEHSRPKRGQPSFDSKADPPPASSVALSYEDRHYRPAAPESDLSAAPDRARGDRGRDDYIETRHRPRRDVTPPSPPPPRGHERPVVSTSVSHGRESRAPRSSRGRRGDNTDADLSTQRTRPAATGNHWAPSNSAIETDNHQRQGSAVSRQQTIDSHEHSPEEGFPPARNGNGRSRHRDHDHSHPSQTHERSRDHGQNISAPRPRTPSLPQHPPRRHESDTIDDQSHPQDQFPEAIPLNGAPPTSQAQSPPPVQRKVDRSSRFGQTSTSTAPATASLPPAIATSVQIAITKLQTFCKVPKEDIDPHLPDDINAEPQLDLQTVRDELTPSISQQVPLRVGDLPSGLLYPDRHERNGGRDQDEAFSLASNPHIGQERSSPIIEAQGPRRRRAPLPPQDARFREIRSMVDRGGPRQASGYVTRTSPVQSMAPLPRDQRYPAGGRDNVSPYQNYAPPPEEHGIRREHPRSIGDGGIIDRGRGRGDSSASGYRPRSAPNEPPANPETNETLSASRLSTSPSSRHLDLPAHSMDYEGSRVATSAAGFKPISPTLPTSYPGGSRGDRNVDHAYSPPLSHVANRGAEGGRDVPHQSAGGWKDMLDDDRQQERREPRGQTGRGFGPTSELYPSDTIGPNSASTRPPRGGRGRGGRPPQEDGHDRVLPSMRSDDRLDRHRPVRSEVGGPPQRGREGDHTYEKPSLSVNTTVTREPGPRSGGNYPNRYNTGPPIDSLHQQPRLWTPRGESPPRELLRGSFIADNNSQAATPPPLSREPSSHISPTWPAVPPERGRQAGRFPDDAQAYERSGHVREDARQRQYVDNDAANDVTIRMPPRANNSLERRLGDRLPVTETGRQLHALPPNPTLHPGHAKSRSPEARRQNVPFNERSSFRGDEQEPPPFRDHAPRGHYVQGDEGLSPSARGSRPSRRQRFGDPAHPDDYMTVDGENYPANDVPQEYRHSYDDRRPENPRRGGSLLDRLSFDQAADARRDTHSPSLRDRVQVPSKRDREDAIMNERYPNDNSFDGDEGSTDPSHKRMRRRSGKGRRARRGV